MGSAWQPIRQNTYADLVARADDGRCRELVDGQFVDLPRPNSMHQFVRGRLAFTLANFEDGEGYFVGLGPLDVMLSNFTVVQLDLFVTRDATRFLEAYFDGPPALVIEVIDERERAYDRIFKRALYAKFGVPEYWVVDAHAKTIELLVHTGDGYGQHVVFEGDAVARSHQFESVQVPLTELFAAVGANFRKK